MASGRWSGAPSISEASFPAAPTNKRQLVSAVMDGRGMRREEEEARLFAKTWHISVDKQVMWRPWRWRSLLYCSVLTIFVHQLDN